jgi:hypothetical protein
MVTKVDEAKNKVVQAGGAISNAVKKPYPFWLGGESALLSQQPTYLHSWSLSLPPSDKQSALGIRGTWE